ncbi:MAG: hypothetical protein ABJB66_18910, partial [Gemmatimonadaceae bacterium]
AFTFRLVPGSVPISRQTRVTEIGLWRRKADHFAFDFGVNTNPLRTTPALTLRKECPTTIGGHPAIIVTGKTPDLQFFVGAHWAVLPGSAELPTVPRKLTLSATTPDSTTVAQLYAMLFTVRFNTKP